MNGLKSTLKLYHTGRFLKNIRKFNLNHVIQNNREISRRHITGF